MEPFISLKNREYLKPEIMGFFNDREGFRPRDWGFNDEK